jgi:hypothetical protein
MNNSQIARRMQSVRPSPTAVISDRTGTEAAGKPVINLGEGELDFATRPISAMRALKRSCIIRLSIPPFPAPPR